MSAIAVGTVTIANGQTVSGAIDLGEFVLVGLQNATLTSTAMTFQASSDGVTYVAVKKVDGNSYSITVASDTYTAIPMTDLVGLRYIKVVAGSAEGAARTVLLMMRRIQ